MYVSVSKRRPRTSQKAEKQLKVPRTCGNNICSCCVPLTILFLFSLFIWSTSTTVISGNVVHICISPRKLNGLYCLTAGSQPDLHVPGVNNFTKPVNGDSIVFSKDQDKSLAKNESFTGETLGERVSALAQDFKSIHEENLDHNLDLVLDWDSKTGEKPYRYFKPKDEDEETALEAVDKYLQIQRYWLSMGNKLERRGSCKGEGIYVYELPSKFNKDLLRECSGSLKNDGWGEPIENLGKGWFRTDQFSLEPIFHSRVLKHPCRVYDEHQAKLFYVPFYGAIDVLRWQFQNVSDVNDVLAIEVVKWLASKESWRRNSGKDHVFVLGKISFDFRRNANFSWGSSLLEMQEMRNPTKLLIERHPWEINDVAIPYPTYFHPKNDDDITSWQNEIIRQPRRSLISFAGGARPGNSDSIRSILIDQCTSSPDQCRFLNCTGGGCNKPETVIKLFQESEFCLQPPGDSPTRRSIFDSLIAGCIPVIFDPYSAYYQYTWHLPEDHRTYSVYINKEDVRGKRVNVIEKLMSKTPREREDMRSYIAHELLPGLVYGDSNAKFERFRDAFDITMDSLLQKITNIIHVERQIEKASNLQLSCM